MDAGGIITVGEGDRAAGRALRPCPDDFEAMFVLIGRLACEEHYRTARLTIDRWLSELGKDRLIAARAAFARKLRSDRRRKCPEDFAVAYPRLGREQCMRHYQVGPKIIRRWIEETGRDLQGERAANATVPKLSRADVSAILRGTFPVEGDASLTTARHAAQFLRIRRNGGWIISPAPGGLWWIGSRRRTAAELVALADAAGFRADLSGGGDAAVEPRP